MREVEGLTRRFTTEISPLIGPERDIPAPDVNTNAQTMAWIMDTYSMHHGYTIAGVVTGKPIAIGGSLGRNEATARGAVFTLLQWAKVAKRTPLEGQRVAIQGYGNAGSIAATLLAAEGAVDRRRQRLDRRHPQPGGPRSGQGQRLEAGARHRRRIPRCRRGHEPGDPRARLRHPRPRRAREPDHRSTTRRASRPRSSPRPPTARRRPRRTRSSTTAGSS